MSNGKTRVLKMMDRLMTTISIRRNMVATSCVYVCVYVPLFHTDKLLLFSPVLIVLNCSKLDESVC